MTTTTLAVESERYLKDLFAREKLPVNVVRQHIFGYHSDQKFDAIVNMGVTEHLPDYKTTLAKYAELLKPGGKVYLDALAMRRKHGISTFMKRYIYPGNSAPLLLHQYLRHVSRSPFELISVARRPAQLLPDVPGVGQAAGRAARRDRGALGRAALPAVPAVPLGLGRRLRHRAGAGVPLGAEDARLAGVAGEPIKLSQPS